MLRSIGGRKAVLALLLAFLLALALGATAFAQEDEGSEGVADEGVTEVLPDEGEAPEGEELPEGETDPEATVEDSPWSGSRTFCLRQLRPHGYLWLDYLDHRRRR